MFFILFFIASLYAQIIQAPNLTPLEKELETVDQDTWVIFDIDDVLLKGKDELLLPCGGKFIKKMDLEFQKKYSLKHCQMLWSLVRLQGKEELVDPKIRSIIQNLLAKKIQAIALTNAITGPLGKIKSLEEWRVGVLKKQGIDFSRSFGLKSFRLNLKPKISQNGIPTYYGGVLFAAGLPKGKVLKAFLEKIKRYPKKFIFIDDKCKNLEFVEECCREMGIEFIGLHYTAVQNFPKTLNEKRAKFQFSVLEKEHKWLSDQEADLRLKSLKNVS